MQTVWASALGDYRNKYFHYTQRKITAAEAKVLGVVVEVLPDNHALLIRANQLAEQLLKIPESCITYPC